jgi:hypothetical protein
MHSTQRIAKTLIEATAISCILPALNLLCWKLSMDESALKELIASLGNQLSLLGWWMYFWTAMVILGCAGELFFVIHAYLDERKIWLETKARGAIGLPEKPSLWVLILEVTSVALVVVGIAGELFVDWKSDDLQTRLRDANGSLVLKLEKSAGEAKDSAKAAAIDATTAKVASAGAVTASGTALNLAKGAHKEADSFEADIVLAKKQAAEAESHLAEARARAASAETKATEVKEQLADRELTNDQLWTIAGKLKKFEGQEYEIVAYWQSPESKQIAERIHAMLVIGARWKFNPEGRNSMLVGGQVAVQVFSHPDADESTKQAAQALVDALNAEGVKAIAVPQFANSPKNNIIKLSIGSKN